MLIYIVSLVLIGMIFVPFIFDRRHRFTHSLTLWNGKEAEGMGRTGEIVAYAKEHMKPISHINTDTLYVNKINFEGIL